MRLLIGSNIFGNGGYPKTMRELGTALNDIGFETVSVQARVKGHTLGRKHHCLLREKVEARKGDTLLVRPYFEPTPKPIAGMKIVGYIALESTKLPERLVRESNSDLYSQIWVPSNHSKYYAARSGIIEDKIRVVPHGYDPNIFKVRKQKNTDAESVANGYRFLFVGGYTGRGDRKGADLLAEAFHEEFNPEPNPWIVELLMKINTGYGPFPAHDLTIDPRIKIATDEVSDESMADVYRQGDCFVSPSYGEAFNMTVLEAMACGLPYITSWFGGQLDYINDLDPNSKRGCLIYNGKYIPARYSPHDIGDWFKPNMEFFKGFMRDMFKIKPKVKTYKGITRWSWVEAAKKAKACMEELC